MASNYYTHTRVVREADGQLRSTTAAKVVDGKVVDVAGHFAYGRGTAAYHATYESAVRFERSQGRSVELVADGAAMHRSRLAGLVA
jgi:hypothetical protein